METLSLRFDHGIAGSRSLGNNNSGRHNVAESNHGTSYTVPRQQPVDIIIPSAAPSPEEDYVLKVVQQPEIAKVAAPKEKGGSMPLGFTPLQFANYWIVCSSDTTRPSSRHRTLIQKPGVKQVRWPNLIQPSPYSFRQNIFEQPLFLRQCRART